jgi:hypothetical protein
MSAKNRIQDLRDHLFETLEALKDAEKPIDVDRAKAICAVAGQIIDSARVELKFMEVVGQDSNKAFFEPPPKFGALPAKTGTGR